MIFFYTKWSILNASFYVDFKAPIDTLWEQLTLF